MIGVFDSGLGGLTILRALAARFPDVAFVYLGDHANVPYGERSSNEIVELTRAGVSHLFHQGCRLVILGCNTATTVAARELQQNWLPSSEHAGCNLLGIVAPTVEAATQTPWAVTTPQYPQKFNTDTIAVFATSLTVNSQVYVEEIAKRCPRVIVYQQACPGLVSAIEQGADEAALEVIVELACNAVLSQLDGNALDHVILGCTHYPIVAHLFARHLPARTRMFLQPTVVADSLDDYLERHPGFVSVDGLAPDHADQRIRLLTTGDPKAVTTTARRIWPDVGEFQGLECGSH